MSETKVDWIDKAHDWVSVAVDGNVLLFQTYDDKTMNAAAIYDVADSERIITAIRTVTGTAEQYERDQRNRVIRELNSLLKGTGLPSKTRNIIGDYLESQLSKDGAS